MSAIGIGLSLAAQALVVGGIGAGIYGSTGGFGEDQAKAVGGASKEQVKAGEGALVGQEEANAAAAAAAQQAQAGLDPYAQAGTNSLAMQQALAGSLGPEAQAKAYEALRGGPAYAQMMEAASGGILQNASATGGLRGGNTQAALGQLGPEILQQLIQQQYGQLAGLSQQGAGAAGQQGQFGLQGAQLGMQGAGMTGQLQQDIGAYRAGGILGETQARLAGRREAMDMGLQVAGTGAKLATGSF
jgi:hypothetical protein